MGNAQCRSLGFCSVACFCRSASAHRRPQPLALCLQVAALKRARFFVIIAQLASFSASLFFQLIFVLAGCFPPTATILPKKRVAATRK
ncbi:hypothetical protein GQ54DRAFT_2416 [Martensiomyces pterosporus]|nr:hypothetical protein GQ54DRAFT_2416 [Martensiomyces pterosporus]